MYRLKLIITMLVAIVTFSGCSHYKSTWSCKNPHGIGCSSVHHADEIARKHIVLSEDITKQEDKKKVLIKKHYSDFKEYQTELVEIE